MHMRTAIVYDRVNKWGGAERVLLALYEIFPNADLITSVYSPEGAPWAQKFNQINTSFLQKIPFAKNNHDKLALLMPFAFETHNLDEYDLVISVTSEFAKSVITSPNTLHICYCLSPVRYLWSGHEDYFDNRTKKILSKPFVSILRRHDRSAAHRPDVMIAISTEVQDRIKKYYNRQAEIIFPPVDTDKFVVSNKMGNYYLIVSRLVPYKKVDIAVKAFNELDYPLIIIGEGSEENYLRSIAGESISFTGKLTDNELAGYYLNCKALVFPQLEDFGIVALEAQAAGKPVIAYGKGGARDTVISGKTGVFFQEQTVESLIDAIHKFEKSSFDPKFISNHAKRFDKKRFQKEFKKLVNEHI